MRICAGSVQEEKQPPLVQFAGPFQSLIFADSICSLATAAPLVYITKPWKFASWRLVVTLLAFQVMAHCGPHMEFCRGAGALKLGPSGGVAQRSTLQGLPLSLFCSGRVSMVASWTMDHMQQLITRECS